MNSFDLSLAVPAKQRGEVMASPKYDTKFDTQKNEQVKQTVTEDGVTINKAQAPELILSGPLSYKYTRLLDTELSVESMAAVVAAAGAAQEEEIEAPPGTPGFVAMGSTGPIIEDDTDAGYIYVVGADAISGKEASEITQHLIDKRIQAPERPMGLAMLIDKTPSPSMESLFDIAGSLNIAVTTMESGLCAMIATMKKKKEG